MLRVLIVDDEILARDELAYLLKRTNEELEINEAENIESAFDQMMDQKPDLLFLDVDLSGENGFDIAKRLKNMKNPPAIVFATAYDQYALKAFEVDALDYLTKPFDEERVRQTMKKYKKVKREIDEPEQISHASQHKLALSVGESIVIVDTKDIIFAGTEDGHVHVKTFDASYSVNDTLVVIEKKLPETDFLRVHRSFVVNTEYIKEIQPWFNSTYNLIMKDGSKIPVSRTYAKELKKLLHI
ncbi:LytR/AlgR family response regulator transcription factor [Bacillus halotolerans]|uniref:LytR/AlgR family response regulator transcription factor n=1 Tax=Bacillus TaxID=1386 RepID=UPI000D03754B|nr:MULTISPECIES: LytTR family DNA-binding domain-containing protein [Bacillus]MBL6007699.1 response regulator transcription factor [Bacillus halotolerans]MCY8978589.1 LytTR family DNA-binding domain-containing protein [Bacillus halotolerans]MDL5613019.1 LytTR family DNA-binding domain-containing protein [Bacillus halotolerans]MDP4525412.1 LytTR family DNA-binding domain-containing protein [Bacillus halotolerans]MDY7430345.1 LytTR family DNA-binding domain-containing protein [Bacillus sp. V26]